MRLVALLAGRVLALCLDVGPALGQGTLAGQGAPCSVFSRHPCAPTVCSVFRRPPCVPEIQYPLGENLQLTIVSAATEARDARPQAAAEAEDSNEESKPDSARAPDGERRLDTLQDMFADGTYARIYKGWFGAQPDEPEIWPGEASQSTALIAPTATALPTLTPVFTVIDTPVPPPPPRARPCS